MLQTSEKTVTVCIIREGIEEELKKISEMEIIDELTLENFKAVLEKNWLKNLMKKKLNANGL